MPTLKNHTFVFIASVPWQYNWQRQHEWATRLARHNKVIYLQPLGMNNHGPIKILKKLFQRKQKGVYQHRLSRQIRANLCFISPVFVPWHNIRLINRLNGWLLERQIKKIAITPKAQIIFWTCNPADTVLSLLDRYPKSVVVYDIAMRFLKREDCPKYLASSQNVLARRADIILTDSRASAEDLPPDVSKKINYVPQGVNKKILNAAPSGHKKLSKLKGPKILYLGAKHDSIDERIFEAILKRIPKAHLILTFNPDKNSPTNKHLHYLGPVQFEQIPGLLKDSDVGIIPYKINEYTKGVFPTKMFEYLAAGLPVVSSPLPELLPYRDRLGIAKSPREFGDLVKKALSQDPAPVDSAFIARQTWQSRFATVETLLIKAISRLNS